jgi:hypothetical protein|tara:strand:- start:1384 stop:1509 length:126 start_codon:yes stop_codon:yes gene_type:complete
MLLRNLLADKDISSIRVASYPVLVTALINVWGNAFLEYEVV